MRNSNLRLKTAEWHLWRRARRVTRRRIETLSRADVMARLWPGWRVVATETGPLSTRAVLRKGPLWAAFTLRGTWVYRGEDQEMVPLSWDVASPGDREEMVRSAVLLSQIAESAGGLCEALTRTPDRHEQIALLLGVVDEQVSALRTDPRFEQFAHLDDVVLATRLARLNDEVEARFRDRVAPWVEMTVGARADAERREAAWSAAQGAVLELAGDVLDQWRREAAANPDGMDPTKAAVLDAAIAEALERAGRQMAVPSPTAA